jgi:nicotinate-nucleotide pyrophosphorylase (carboxylating)
MTTTHRPVADPRHWSEDTQEALSRADLPPEVVAAVIDRSLAEDFADGGDVTTVATVPPGEIAAAAIVARQPGVLAGGAIAVAVFESVANAFAQRTGTSAIDVEFRLPDGAELAAGEAALRIVGPVTSLLSAERTALNLLGHLSGVATATRAWVDAVAGTDARIRDTRKTLPGLRLLQKYAVRCGGGVNHRMSLGDAALIKDNHVVAAGSVAEAVAAVRELRPDIPLEVEVDDLDQFDEALAVGAQLILLDNFSLADSAEAVRRVRAGHPGVRLEASGGLTLERAHAVAATGVDFLAIGALTHSVTVLDLGMDMGDDLGLG